MKRCGMCHNELPLDNFHKRSKSLDGLAARCKSCVKEYSANRYTEQKDRINAMPRVWRENNKDRKRATDKAWKVANKEKIHAQERNRTHIRRAKIRSAVDNDPRLMKAEQVIYAFYGKSCMMPECNVVDPSIDHIVPFALGGRHEFENLQVLCLHHNMSKQHREAIDYRPTKISDADVNSIIEVVI